MLVRLLPDDIGKRWPLIREAILDDLPSRISDGIRDNENAISSLLYALLDGTLHCWLSVEYEDGKPEIKAIITTTIVIDAPSKSTPSIIPIINSNLNTIFILSINLKAC